VEALVLIRERTLITEALLARLPNLRLIVQTGKRAPHLDLAACTRQGVAVVYATPSDPGRPYATAELTWGLILATMRFIPQEVASMQADHWQRTLGRALHGRTLGIFGYGHIGSLIATYGQAFGMRVLVWGREGSRARTHADGIEVAASLDALFRDADVLSLPLALTEETRGIVSAADLAKMKPSALFVTTRELGEAVASTMGGSLACYLINHGIVVAGRTIDQAVVSDINVERAGQVQLLAAASGQSLSWTSDEEIVGKRENIFGVGMLRNVGNYYCHRIGPL